MYRKYKQSLMTVVVNGINHSGKGREVNCGQIRKRSPSCERKKSPHRRRSHSRSHSRERKKSPHRRRSRSRSHSHGRKKSPHRKRSRSRSHSHGRKKSPHRGRSRSRSHSHGRKKSPHRKRSRSRSHSHGRKKSPHRGRSRSRSHSHGRKKSPHRKRSRSRSHSHGRKKSPHRKRSCSRSHSHSRPQSADVLKPILDGQTRVIFKPGRHKPVWDPKLWENLSSSEDEEAEPGQPPKPKKERKNVGSLEFDYMKSENMAQHHTEEYEIPDLVVRRGQEFLIKLKLGHYDAGEDQIRIQFRTGQQPQRNKGTLAIVKIRATKEEALEDAEFDGWYGYMHKVNGTELTIAIFPSSLAPVGRYLPRVYISDLQENNVRKDFIRQCQDPILILFNPWNKEDQVYLENEEERDEYVLSESGAIWVGSATRNSGRKWNFNQFSTSAIEAALHLLSDDPERTKLHGNATIVCRDLSALTNSCNDSPGALTGNWSGDYSGGTKPTKWIGSEKILEEYCLTHRAVNYGQCWVFSGLITTLCRSLGIPCRSVTNFASAHDTNLSLTIDMHLNQEGDPIEHMNGDSVWNFHVWNEAWFKRPDLPEGYDGWQAFDSTPQEMSDGLMQCGPASVKAIKEGLVFQNYDCKFIYAEVNGDRVTWEVLKNGDMKVIGKETHSIGKNISTRGPGGVHLDVTGHYKYPEGSEEERAASKRATQFSTIKEFLAVDYDCQFAMDAKIKPNNDIDVEFEMTNKSAEPRTLNIKLSQCAAFYTGRSGTQLGCQKMDPIVLPAGATQKESWTITGTSYLNEIQSDAKLKITVSCRVIETQQLYVHQDVIECDKPDIVAELSTKQAKVGEKFTVTFKLKNPLDIPLTECELEIEGPGVMKSESQNPKDIPPGEELVVTKEMAAKYKGKREIVACLNTRQLTGLTGSCNITITN